MLLYDLAQLGRRHYPRLPPYQLSVFEQGQCRHALHLVGLCYCGIFIYINFYDAGLVAYHFFQVGEDGAIILHGPHHSAKKSISTSGLDFRTCENELVFCVSFMIPFCWIQFSDEALRTENRHIPSQKRQQA